MSRRLVCLLLFAPLAASAQNLGPIGSVTAGGSHRFSSAEIVATSGLAPGQSATPQSLQAAVNRLMATRCFANISFLWGSAANGLAITLTATDAAAFAPVRFDNFVWFQPSELAAALAGVPLYHGEVPLEPDGLADTLRQRLQALLTTRHLPGQVTTLLDIPSDPDTSPSVTFRVAGVSMPIVSLTFPGASPRFVAPLTAALEPCISGGYSTVSLGPCAQRAARQLYFAQGYLAAHLGPIVAQPRAATAAAVPVALAIPVVEGRAYAITAVAWHGNHALSAATLDALVPGLHAEPQPLLAVAPTLASVRRAYMHRGYLNVVLTPRADRLADAAGVATLGVDIFEGPQFHMGRLRITGNISPVLADDLRQAWSLAPGAPFAADYYLRFEAAEFPLLSGHRWIEIVRNDDTHAANVTLKFLQ